MTCALNGQRIQFLVKAVIKQAACFPATAEIELAGGIKQIGSVTIGDKVHVDSSQYSDVYYFSTAMEDTMSKFVSLATADTKKPLLMTPGNCLLNRVLNLETS